MKSVRSILFFTITMAAMQASGQTIYAPQQIQYGVQTPEGYRTFYYAGNDPYVFYRGAYFGPRTVENEPPRVYLDRFPNVNAARYGYSVDDVRNEANAFLPRYYSKRPIGGTRYARN